jgi:hypothetical protein
MKKLSILLLLFAATAAYSQSFTKVNVSSMGKVFITQGETNSVVASGSEKESSYIRDNTLYITGKDNTEYRVTMQNVEKLTISGSGEITAENTISSLDLTLDISGSGTIKAPLEVKDLTLNIGGAGKMILSGTAENASANVSG